MLEIETEPISEPQSSERGNDSSPVSHATWKYRAALLGLSLFVADCDPNRYAVHRTSSQTVTRTESAKQRVRHHVRVTIHASVQKSGLGLFASVLQLALTRPTAEQFERESPDMYAVLRDLGPYIKENPELADAAIDDLRDSLQNHSELFMVAGAIPWEEIKKNKAGLMQIAHNISAHEADKNVVAVRQKFPAGARSILSKR